MKNIWDKNFNRPPCLHADIESLEKKLLVRLPDLYKKIMLIQNGGYLRTDEFKYKNLRTNEEKNGMIGIVFSVGGDFCETIEDCIADPPEFFPSGLIPFCGDSNIVCFNYSLNTNDPSIVFWCHGDSEGEDVHFVANNFEEFINMLHEPED